MELARNRNDLDEQQRLVSRDGDPVSAAASGWPRRCFQAATCTCCAATIPTAVEYYSYLATHFPENKNAAAAHWRAGWLSYRQGLYADAARLFDEQIKLYPSDKETAAALYWRGRLYETQDHKPASAAANYRTMVRVYQHFFLCADGARAAGGAGQHAAGRLSRRLDRFQAPPVPQLDDSFPDDSPHLAKARLLANAGLNEYIAAGDCGRSRLGFVERAGRGADLRVVWRDLSRHAGAEEGSAVCRNGVHQVHSAGLLAHSVSRSRGGRRSRRSRRRTISIRIWWPR